MNTQDTLCYNSDVMIAASEEAEATMQKGYGGPFGAAIADSNGKIICVAANRVIELNDPTAHAEINAIRTACSILGTYDLSGYVLYATSEPCPMCLSAIMWANIKTVYYGTTAEQAADIGFRDDYMYKFISQGRQDNTVMEMHHRHSHMCKKLFDDYAKQEGIIY